MITLPIFVSVIMVGFFVAGDALAAEDYDDLRSMSGTPDQIENISTSGIAGDFIFSSTDPHGFGDDGGIVIQASNGWWVRQFAHTLQDPIQLDWFEVEEGDNITDVLHNYSTIYSPALYVRAPNTAMTLYADPIDFGVLGITYFAFLESDVPVLLQQTGTGATLWSFTDVHHLVLGSLIKKDSRNDYNLTISGTWSQVNTGALGTGYGTQIGMISIEHTSVPGADAWYLRLNTKNPKGQAIRFYGWAGKAYPDQPVHISGIHENGFGIIGFWKGDIILENPLITDPYGRMRGWQGSTEGVVFKDHSEVRAGGFGWIASIGTCSGEIEFAYGDAGFGGGFNDSTTQIMRYGTGPDNPLIIKVRDYGYSGPAAENLGWTAGVPLDNPWFMAHALKFDGLPRWNDPRHIELRYSYEYGPARTSGPGQFVFLEANAADEGSSNNREVSYITWTLVEIEGPIRLGVGGVNTGDAIHHLIYQGNGHHVAMRGGSYSPGFYASIPLSIYDTARYGQFHDIIISESGSNFDTVWEPGWHNRIETVTLTGELKVQNSWNNPGDNIANNVTFLGAAREVINVATGASLELTNVCAPSGSTIGGGGEVLLNGSEISIPYTIHPNDCTEPVPEIPPNPYVNAILRADFNSDSTVNIFDYNTLLTNFGATSDCGNQADANEDCSVNIFDYNVLLGEFGMSV